MQDQVLVLLKEAEFGHFIKNRYGMGQLRIKRKSHRHADAGDRNLIYDIQTDPGQRHPVEDPQLERRLERKMEELLKRYDAPDCQYERTGLGRQRED